MEPQPKLRCSGVGPNGMTGSTSAYVARRTAEGRSKRELIRSLKRYVARALYRRLPRTQPTA